VAGHGKARDRIPTPVHRPGQTIPGFSERLEFPNGSVLQVFAPTADSLHGYTPATVALDEAFAHDEKLGDELMGAIEPAQQTLPHRQLWVVSTRGDVDSVFLDGWLEKGRAGPPVWPCSTGAPPTTTTPATRSMSWSSTPPWASRWTGQRHHRGDHRGVQAVRVRIRAGVREPGPPRVAT
jgi:hypothetical protein